MRRCDDVKNLKEADVGLSSHPHILTSSHPPAFILLAPQMGENIGAVARAMSNFGLSDLRIVAPRDGWPNPAAEAMAAHGEHLIKNALVVDTLGEALTDITTLYATTPRQDVLGKPVFSPGEVMQTNITLQGERAGVAILFGPERAGLSNEDIVLCDGIISIPVSAENPSLNIAQAAVVIAYEWFINSRKSGNPEISGVSHHLKMDPRFRGDVSTKAELEGLFDHAKILLDRVNYFREPGKTKLMWQHMRSIWVKSELTSQEVRTLRGMVRAILRLL